MASCEWHWPVEVAEALSLTIPTLLRIARAIGLAIPAFVPSRVDEAFNDGAPCLHR